MFRGIDVQFERIHEWPNKPTAFRRSSPFRSTLEQSYKLLERELNHLSVKMVVIEADCEDWQIRNDGMIRSDAKLRGPGVILSFETKYGPVRYPCDNFTKFADNIRAIALALEALRKVDRYGVTKRGEQYKGWAALPPPNGDHWTKKEAMEFLRSLLGTACRFDAIDDTLRLAELRTHPDKGGNPDDFKKVQRARELLLS